MTDDFEIRLKKVEAQLAIQQLAARYARAIDSRDMGDLGDLFAPAANFGEFGKGADGARAFFRSESVLRGFYRSFHQVVGHVITHIESTSARGTVYCRAEHEDGDNWVVILMVYFDRYIRHEGRWYFLGRRPRYLSVSDHRDTPRNAHFSTWPGRESRFHAELPQSDESWRNFWSDFPEDLPQVTTLP